MGSRAAGGGRSEGEEECDAEGGRMVAKKKGNLCGPGAQSCTSTAELASVYIQHKTIRAGQREGQTVRKKAENNRGEEVMEGL